MNLDIRFPDKGRLNIRIDIIIYITKYKLKLMLYFIPFRDQEKLVLESIINI